VGVVRVKQVARYEEGLHTHRVWFL